MVGITGFRAPLQPDVPAIMAGWTLVRTLPTLNPVTCSDATAGFFNPRPNPYSRLARKGSTPPISPLAPFRRRI